MSASLITRGKPPTLAARKPTGKPAWPMLLMAGAQSCGKTYSAAAFSASDLIDRTFVVEVGEGTIDQYGAIPGARFEVLEHDGTFMSIARQLWAATLVPRGPSGKPHAIVLDSATEVWDLVTSEQQELANARRARKNNGNQSGADDAPITMDQWNSAKKRWRALVDLLRSHDGPVIWTARFEQVTVMDKDGKPTTEKSWKIRTEKNLPYEVDGIIEIPEARRFFITKVRSLRLQLEPSEHRLVEGFTVDGFLRDLGLAEEVGARHYTAPDAAAYVGEFDAEQARAQEQAQMTNGTNPGRKSIAHWMGRIGEVASKEQGQALWREINAAGQVDVDFEGTSLGDRVVGRVEQLMKDAAAGTPAQPAAEQPPAEEAVPATQPAEQPPASSRVLAEPDPADLRKDTAPRRGVVNAIVATFADSQEAADAACEQTFGFPIAQVGTKRLRDWMATDLLAGTR